MDHQGKPFKLKQKCENYGLLCPSMPCTKHHHTSPDTVARSPSSPSFLGSCGQQCLQNRHQLRRFAKGYLKASPTDQLCHSVGGHVFSHGPAPGLPLSPPVAARVVSRDCPRFFVWHFRQGETPRCQKEVDVFCVFLHLSIS